MWTRSELKTKAKADLKICYWKAVVASIVLTVAAGSSGGSTAGAQNNEEVKSAFSNFSMEELMVLLGIVLAVIGVAIVVGIIIKIFVFNPISVGCHKFFLEGTGEKGAELNEIVFSFKNNYMNQVLVCFMTNLFIALWSLLLVIPGIIKSYEYRMVKFILSENPDINYKDALAKSKEMMNGQKWNAFVLDLSFILWYLLSGCTLGLVHVFYVGPYFNFTNAELYVALKKNA